MLASDLALSFLLLSDTVAFLRVEAAIVGALRTDERLIGSTDGWLRSQLADILNISLVLSYSKSLKPSLLKFDLIVQECFWASDCLCFEIFLGVLVGQIVRLCMF